MEIGIGGKEGTVLEEMFMYLRTLTFGVHIGIWKIFRSRKMNGLLFDFKYFYNTDSVKTIKGRWSHINI